MRNLPLNRTFLRVWLETWCLIVLMGLFSLMATLAPASALKDEEDDTFIGIGGLVVDETRTVAGRRFFEGLASQLTDLGGQTENIVVTELADPRFGSRLSVSVGDTLVFRQFLSPRLGDVDKVVEQAVSRVQRAMQEKQQLQQQLEMY